MSFDWDWKKLLQQVIPIILSWLLGALGVGPNQMPDRLLNKAPVTVPVK